MPLPSRGHSAIPPTPRGVKLLPGDHASVVHVWRRMSEEDEHGVKTALADYWLLYGGIPGGVVEGRLLCLVERTLSVKAHVPVLFDPEGYSARVGAPLLWSREWISFPLHPEGVSTQFPRPVYLVVPVPWVQLGFWGRATQIFKVLFGILPDVGRAPFSAVLASPGPYAQVTCTTTVVDVAAGAPVALSLPAPVLPAVTAV